MGIKGIIFISLAILGAVINYTSRPLSEKLNFSQLKIKITAAVIVLLSVTLLFIFGK